MLYVAHAKREPSGVAIDMQGGVELVLVGAMHLALC